jgi:hypothetical protein
MAGFRKGPFLVSGVLTMVGVLGWLLARESPEAPAIPPEARSPEESAFVDPRTAVAHPVNVLANSLAAGLDWLERHQYSEGLFSARYYTQLCEGEVCPGRGREEHDTGLTALAVLAILESGRARPKYELCARRGLAWLAGAQDSTGCVGLRAGKYMYGHALATLAFVRGYSVLGDADYRRRAARAVRFLEMARNPGLAWRYGFRDGDNDTSVTAWAGAALAAAADPEIDIPVDPTAFEGIRRWLSDMSDEGSTSYARRGGGGASVRGQNDQYEPSEGLTAMALWLRLQMGADRNAPEIRAMTLRLGGALPTWNKEGTSVDFTAWFAGTRALAVTDSRGLWEAWSRRVLSALLRHQRRFNEGCRVGSWDPVDKWGQEGGRLYSTSINLLTLGILSRMSPPAASAPSR